MLQDGTKKAISRTSTKSRGSAARRRHADALECLHSSHAGSPARTTASQSALHYLIGRHEVPRRRPASQVKPSRAPRVILRHPMMLVWRREQSARHTREAHATTKAFANRRHARPRRAPLIRPHALFITYSLLFRVCSFKSFSLASLRTFNLSLTLLVRYRSQI